MNQEIILREIKAKGLFRSLFALPYTGGKFEYQGAQLLNFSSNDYLNFAHNTQIKSASMKAIEAYGTGATGSRLMCGHLEIHKQLERSLANFMGYEEAIVFGSGFLTNLGIITTLASLDDIIFYDKLDHASLIDGIRLSRATWKKYEHNDTNNLEDLLSSCQDDYNQKFIITDSLFSMDGDLAPVKKIKQLAQKYNAYLIVDEAHAIGVFGENGSGYCNQINIKPDIITGTLSKSLASYGGFAACTRETKELLINKARSFIYSSALPPSCIGSALEAISIIEKEDLGNTLLEKSKFFYDLLNDYGLSFLPFESQIIPIIVGENDKAIQLAKSLLHEGIYLKAIRPPTVPIDTARIRLSVTLAHSKDDLQFVAKKIYEIAKNLRII